MTVENNSNTTGIGRIQIKRIMPNNIPVTGLPFEDQSDCMWIQLNMPILKGETNGN